MTMIKALIVEDEALIAMMLESFLEDLGCEVTATASNIQDAINAASIGQFDIAFLDVNLNGQKTHPLAGILRRRAKPFAFVTGYGLQGVLSVYADAPTVTKPYTFEIIAQTLEILRTHIVSPDSGA